MLPGNSSQGLSQSCISAISIVMPPSVSMNEAETALRMKGGGASLCVLHADPEGPTGTAPPSDPAARRGSVRTARLPQKPQTAQLKTRGTPPAAAAPSALGISAQAPARMSIQALALIGQDLPC